MKIQIQQKSRLSLREQIKRQIMGLIENRHLLPGQALLSARDLSSLIHVNRNTITHAYKELESEGILEIIVGSGTYVRHGLVLKSKQKLDQVFDASVQKALEFGFSKSEIIFRPSAPPAAPFARAAGCGLRGTLGFAVHPWLHR